MNDSGATASRASNPPGRLKVFFGAPGAGQTLAMLQDAQGQLRSGIALRAGLVAARDAASAALLASLPQQPPRRD
ncbi:hypothetical protein E5198_19390, partial [Pseudomonas sp. A-1]